MANGFAMRGFTQGLTQGLQNANDLYNSYVNRDLQRAESERLRKGQETQDRWYEAQARNQEMDNARQERMLKMNEQKGGLEIKKSELDLAKEELSAEQARKQAEYPRIYGILNKQGDFTEDDFKALNDFGLGSLLSGEDDSAELKRLAEGVRSGQLAVDDPEVANKLLPALTPMLNRRPGSVGVDPNTGQQIRVTDKTPIGFQRIQGRAVPMLRVRGANADGQAVEYVAPATQFASSSKDDPLLELTQSEAARRLTGAAWLNRQAAKNPELRKSLLDYASLQANGVPKPISQLDQAKTQNEQDKVRSRQLQDQIKRLEYISGASQGKAKEEAERALTELRKEQTITEQSKQDKNWADADSKGLGSVSKNSGSGGGFDIKRAESVANQYYPIPDEPKTPPADDPLGEKYQKGKADLLDQRQKFIRTIQGLVTTGGMSQEKAELAAGSGQQELFAAKDGHTYWVVNTFDEKGNPIKVPFAQVK